MKTMQIKLHTIILALFIITPILSNAQKAKSVENKIFSFDESSKTESFSFTVEKGTENLEINLVGNISQGSLKVKITDPDGNRISGFSIKSSKSKNKSFSTSSNSSSSSSSRSSSRSSTRSSSSSSSNSSSTSVSVSVEIDDSDKVKENETSINTHIHTSQKTERDNEGARGVLAKKIKNPLPGNWEVSIHPDNASGKLSTQISHK